MKKDILAFLLICTLAIGMCAVMSGCGTNNPVVYRTTTDTLSTFQFDTTFVVDTVCVVDNPCVFDTTFVVDTVKVPHDYGNHYGQK